jgi:peptidylprolyl isomerase
MSIRGMQKRFAVRLRYVLYVLIGVFVVGLPFVFTPGLSRRNEGEGSKESKDIVARVNGQGLTRDEVDSRFDQALGQLAIYAQLGQNIGLQQMAQFRLSAFQQAVTDDLLRKQAAADKISVSRGEVKRQAEVIADQQLEQLRAQYKGDQIEPALGRIVAITDKQDQARNMSPAAFRKWFINRLLDKSREQLQWDLTLQKLQEKVTASTGGTEQDLLASYDRLHTRQIMVALKPEGKPARTDEEARKRAEEVAAKAKQGADFAALAKADSDDKRSAEKGGEQPIRLLQAYSPNMQKVVRDLKPGEVSTPIKTAAGYIIVKMESRPRELPKDFEKNKQQLLASFAQRRKSEAWQEYAQSLQQSAKVDVTDPELLAYQAMQQGNEKDAFGQLQKAAGQASKLRGLVGAIIYYNLAEMYVKRSQWKEAADSFTAAADAVSQDQKQALPGARAEALMGLAEANEKLGKADDALMWYQEASNWADTPAIHSQLMGVYQRLGKADLVKKEQDWLKDYQQAQMEKDEARVAQQQKAAAAQTPAQNPAAQAPAAQNPGAPKPGAGKPAIGQSSPRPAAGKPAPRPATSKPMPKPAAGKPAPAPAEPPAKTGQ